MAIHKNLTGEQAVHQSAYVQSSDPGAVGALKAWIDTTSDPAAHKVRNADDDGWITVGVAGSSVSDHIADATDAHDASAVSFVPAGTIAATNVQAAVEEVATEASSGGTGLSDHLADTTDAHDASAISFVPAGTIAATNAQAAIEEVATEAAGAVPSASETVQGKIEIADDTEAGAHTDDARAMTPLKVYDHYIPRASGLGTTMDLDSLEDVDAPSPTTDDGIRFDGTDYVNEPMYTKAEVDAAIAAGAGSTVQMMRLERTTNQSIPNITYTAVSWNSEVLDEGNWFSSGTQIPTGAGYFLAEAASVWTANGTGVGHVRIARYNSSNVFQSAAESPATNAANDNFRRARVVGSFKLAAGDYLTVEVYHDRGLALNLGTNGVAGLNAPYVAVTKLA